MSVLLQEHEEDLSRLGGILKRTTAARTSSEEPIERRFLHRIPWLLLGLGGALVAADLVATFESVLRHNVMLAFFIPGDTLPADVRRTTACFASVSTEARRDPGPGTGIDTG